MCIYGAVDDLYQKSMHFSKLKLFFSIRCIRLSTYTAYMHVMDTSLLIKARYNYMHFQPITSRSQRLGTQVALPTWFTDSATMNTRLKCTDLNYVLIPERKFYKPTRIFHN